MKKSIVTLFVNLSLVLVGLSAQASTESYEVLKKVVSEEVCNSNQSLDLGLMNTKMTNLELKAKEGHIKVDSDSMQLLTRLAQLSGDMVGLAIDRSEKSPASNTSIRFSSQNFICSFFNILE